MSEPVRHAPAVDIMSHPITQFATDRCRRHLMAQSEWLLRDWGEWRPPRDHIVLADLVNMEEVVDTIHLQHWVPVWRQPVAARLSAVAELSPFIPTYRTREFHQQGVYASMCVSADVMFDAEFPQPFPYDRTTYAVTFTLLRYVERPPVRREAGQ